MYVWLEGQDVDCTNLASHGGGIEVNLGLVKNEEVTSNVPPPEVSVPEVLPSTEYTTPYLPSGFNMVAGTNLDTGLTIEDSTGNEYVWVEVLKTAEVYQTAGLSLDLDTLTGTELTNAYTAIEEDLHTYTSTYRNGAPFSDIH